ncbi:MAG TPA: DUF1361 domain-containing protein [Candidatus Sulfotelmatobacter sp.]|jgi:uncharacterized membrane protein|nr:DUF1361 domain-containing protein [Candidatus Sulfotelmatobacter sp.]
MPIIDYNISWMIYNCFLALLAVVFGFLSFEMKNKIFLVFFVIIWLLFLPNTIYIFTDLEHLIFQWKYVHMPLLLIVILQYIVLEIVGITTFLLAFLPFEKGIKTSTLFKKRKTGVIITFNFLIAFGMVLGRVERINSWEVFTSPIKVIASAMHVLTTLDLIGLTILFGLFCNFIYFLLRDPFLKLVKEYL